MQKIKIGFMLVLLGLTIGIFGIYYFQNHCATTKNESMTSKHSNMTQKSERKKTKPQLITISHTVKNSQPSLEKNTIHMKSKNNSQQNSQNKSLDTKSQKVIANITTDNKKKIFKTNKNNLKENVSQNLGKKLPNKVIIYFAKSSKHISSKNKKRITQITSPNLSYDIYLRCGDGKTYENCKKLCKKRSTAIINLMEQSFIKKNKIHIHFDIPKDPSSDLKYQKSRWRRAVIKVRR